MSLKPLWSDPGVPTPDPGGAGPLGRGSDPNASGNPGPNGLDPLWPNPVMPAPSGEESSNSLSGLPSLPNRYDPAEAPPDPPNLTDRMPGTIDKR